ncbi:hypothetical protein HanXRQr2_Chr09g0375211 [Helianthus annuus]|uniref:Uncharacterized protein n=1 Tax=Helianthus annuus TaxID=4232 RepID=A0A9K3I3I0_HELAN|nr:hypothetical protein HanXRQr2_Chr09g0375211 [Helianthus annuus]KAJ0892089.1 hypothetical protein HanPSC8_Chr09g0361731 [Helianthus annuus]
MYYSHTETQHSSPTNSSHHFTQENHQQTPHESTTKQSMKSQQFSETATGPKSPQ